MVSLDDFTEILFNELQIQQRVAQLACKIVQDYEGKTLIVLGVMKGAAPFMQDLCREIYRKGLRGNGNIAVNVIEDIAIMSMYPSPDLQLDQPEQILGVSPAVPYEGNEVLIVEDIVDRGLTVMHLRQKVLLRTPTSVRVCSLLNKPSKRQVDLPVDYVGFEVGDQFVVGYGLDYLEQYRHVPFIGVLKPEVYRSSGK